MAAKTIKVTQIGSPIGRPEKQRATLIGLGTDILTSHLIEPSCILQSDTPAYLNIF